MTPLELRICLHYYYSPEDWVCVSEVDANIVKQFAEWGLLKRFGEGAAYERTDRLIAFVDHLCAQRLPVQKWVVE